MERKTAIVLVTIVVIAAIAVAAYVLTQNGGEDDKPYYVIDGNGGLTEDWKTTVTIYDSVVTDTEYFTYPSDGDVKVKGTIYYTENKDGSGTVYTAGSSIDSGTTIYAKWNPVLYGLVDEAQAAGMFSFMNTDDTEQTSTVAIGTTTYDSTCMVSVDDSVVWDAKSLSTGDMSVSIGYTGSNGEAMTLTVKATNVTALEAEAKSNSLRINFTDIQDGFSLELTVEAAVTE